jgi:hypothetical protein
MPFITGLWGVLTSRIFQLVACALVCLVLGFVKGEQAANSATYQATLDAALKAAADKEALQQQDAARADAAEAENQKLKDQLTAVLSHAKSSPSACSIDPATLRGLCQLAGNASGDCAPLPAAAKRRQKAVRG